MISVLAIELPRSIEVTSDESNDDTVRDEAKYASTLQYIAKSATFIPTTRGIDNEIIVFPKAIAWDWPFCDEGVARGVFAQDKFMMCLPFQNHSTSENNGATKKFEKISEGSFSWTVGLSNSGDFGTGFWRMELEIMRNLNMLALAVCRDISRTDEPSKRLRRVRKVYRLPDHYDVRTLTSRSYGWAIVLEAWPRQRRNGISRGGAGAPPTLKMLRRADTLA